jgi:rapamycin-insensitive companion of mTOR
MLFRALHTISTQRYRLPVRRYILDLFTIELDQEVVESLLEWSSALRAPGPSRAQVSPSHRVVSMLGRLGPPSRTWSESDEDEMDEDGMSDSIIKEHPAISLRPVSRIVGFAI